MSRASFREAYGAERIVRQEGGDPVLEQLVFECMQSEVDKVGLTRQADLEGADMNSIVKRYMRDGVWPFTNREPRYLDVSEVGTYQEAVESVRKAEAYFMSLAPESRSKFDNDVGKFLDVVADPAQLDLVVEAGVVPKGEVRQVTEGAEKPPKAPEGA